MIDKLTEEYTIRIPAILKNYIKEMSSEHRKQMNEALRYFMAKKVHESKFMPEKYLTENFEG